MSEHFIRPDNDPEPTAAEINALADEYQCGLDKMVASGYEEFGYRVQRQHALVIAALRAYAQLPAQPQGAQDSLREALDNSQSLLVMILNLGEEYAMLSSRDISSITKEDWAREGLTKLLTDQIVENRRTLSLSRPHRGSAE